MDTFLQPNPLNSFGIDCYWQWFQVAKSADFGMGGGVETASNTENNYWNTAVARLKLLTCQKNVARIDRDKSRRKFGAQRQS